MNKSSIYKAPERGVGAKIEEWSTVAFYVLYILHIVTCLFVAKDILAFIGMVVLLGFMWMVAKTIVVDFIIHNFLVLFQI